MVDDKNIRVRGADHEKLKSTCAELYLEYRLDVNIIDLLGDVIELAYKNEEELKQYVRQKRG